MFCPAEKIIKNLKENNRPFILVDSKDRENEGDLIIPAQLITKEWMNFIITHCKGIPCVCITESLASLLGLRLMDRSGQSENCAYFTTTIEAKKGVTTGISAADRAHTISLLTKKDVSKDHFVTPGHTLPLVINKNGLKKRTGHTEGAATFAKLAGFQPTSVICEILDYDGNSASSDFLKSFSVKHGFDVVSVEDLCLYLENNNIDIRFD